MKYTFLAIILQTIVADTCVDYQAQGYPKSGVCNPASAGSLGCGGSTYDTCAAKALAAYTGHPSGIWATQDEANYASRLEADYRCCASLLCTPGDANCQADLKKVIDGATAKYRSCGTTSGQAASAAKPNADILNNDLKAWAANPATCDPRVPCGNDCIAKTTNDYNAAVTRCNGLVAAAQTPCKNSALTSKNADVKTCNDNKTNIPKPSPGSTFDCFDASFNVLWSKTV